MKRARKMHITVAAAALLLVVVLTASYQPKLPDTDKLSVTFASGNTPILAEVADTPEEHAQGLMFRESLAENGGMLFVFSGEQKRSFWMKNTLIPLDIIFVSSNKTIVDAKENFAPCQEKCEVYESKAPAMYVLEVNAGFVKKNGIRIGDKVRIE